MPRYFWRVAALLLVLVALGELLAHRHTVAAERERPGSSHSAADEWRVGSVGDRIYCQWLVAHRMPARDGPAFSVGDRRFKGPFPLRRRRERAKALFGCGYDGAVVL